MGDEVRKLRGKLVLAHNTVRLLLGENQTLRALGRCECGTRQAALRRRRCRNYGDRDRINVGGHQAAWTRRSW
jgi:hypothetical protein